MKKQAEIGLGVLLVSSGCVAQVPFIQGEVRLADAQIPSPEQYLVVRAVPDHADGFDPRRGYHGSEQFIESHPATAIEFPYAFHVLGPRPRKHDQTWLLLSWLTEDPHAEWLQPGEVYGTQQFELVHTSYGPAFADGLEVTLENVAPPALR